MNSLIILVRKIGNYLHEMEGGALCLKQYEVMKYLIKKSAVINISGQCLCFSHWANSYDDKCIN